MRWRGVKNLWGALIRLCWNPRHRQVAGEAAGEGQAHRSHCTHPLHMRATCPPTPAGSAVEEGECLGPFPHTPGCAQLGCAAHHHSHCSGARLGEALCSGRGCGHTCQAGGAHGAPCSSRQPGSHPNFCRSLLSTNWVHSPGDP